MLKNICAGLAAFGFTVAALTLASKPSLKLYDCPGAALPRLAINGELVTCRRIVTILEGESIL